MAVPESESVLTEECPSEADIDAVIAEFRGDIRALARALLSDIVTLAADRERNVSQGFLRRPPAAKSAA